METARSHTVKHPQKALFILAHRSMQTPTDGGGRPLLPPAGAGAVEVTTISLPISAHCSCNDATKLFLERFFHNSAWPACTGRRHCFN